MNFDEYCHLFQLVLDNSYPRSNYSDERIHFIQLNQARSKRWLKKLQLSQDLLDKIKSIPQAQHWILITEPWCGDAAHTVPVIALAVKENPLIRLEIQLRDQDSEIERYLTNGAKAIPLLIIRDEHAHDLAVWGPRPIACKALYDELSNTSMEKEKIKEELQKWYNKNQGEEIMKELGQLIEQINKGN